MELSAAQLRDILGGEIQGDETIKVNNFNKIEEAQKGDLTFFANSKYESFLYTTKASIILISKGFKLVRDIEPTIIYVDDAYSSMATLLEFIDKEQKSEIKSGIDAKAVVHKSAKVSSDATISAFAFIDENVVIGKGCVIYPYTFVGKGSIIGDNTIIYPNVTIYHSVSIGQNCIIHAGAVIGADGFGFAPQLDGYKKIPQVGSVVIEDNVEIGANTCIDRASIGVTMIRKGAKLDNLVQIAHNCSVGSHTVMASQTGMAGSSSIGEWCQAGGQTGIAGHLKVGDRVNIGGQTGILGNISSDTNIFGSPAMELSKAKRSFVIIPKLPEMWKKLASLEKNVSIIQKQIEKGK